MQTLRCVKTIIPRILSGMPEFTKAFGAGQAERRINDVKALLDDWEKKYAASLWQLYQAGMLEFVDTRIIDEELTNDAATIDQLETLAEKYARINGSTEQVRELQDLITQNEEVCRQIAREKCQLKKKEFQ